MADKVRVDKWLWSVRIFKSRTQASEACKKGQVSVAEEKVKPSFLIESDQEIHVKKNGYNYVFKVDKLISKRVSAPLAQECYTDLTPEEELRKFEDWYIGKSGAERRERGTGRPTKKERRELERFKKKDLGL